MIHTLITLVSKDKWIINGVPPDKLDNAIAYNKTVRIGYALFVDGLNIHPGFFEHKKIKEFEEKFQSSDDYIETFDTHPYR